MRKKLLLLGESSEKWQRELKNRIAYESACALKLVLPPFFKLLRNKFYIGIIKVPAYEEEPEQEVKGRHTPILDDETFYAVQDQLDGKKKSVPKVSRALNPDLYLRKFLYCPVCGYRLTGAVSKGHGGLYPYYCCNHDHSHLNMRAERVNEGFLEYVGKLHPNKAVLALYNEVLMEIRGDAVRIHRKEADNLAAEEEKIKLRIQKVNDMYFDGEISRNDKDENITRYKKDLAQLQDRMEVLRLSTDLNIRQKLDYSMNIIGNISMFFRFGDPELKIKLLGSIFPEKIYFDGKNYRTSRFNHLLGVIFHETKHLQGQKKVESPEKSENSTWVAPSDIISNHFLEDLEKIWELKEWLPDPCNPYLHYLKQDQKEENMP